MAIHIVPSAVVFEVLRDDNYENWSACMKSYLLAQDLWDIIESVAEPPNQDNCDEFKAQRKRNAMALHAIQISCDPQLLSQIRDITSAKIAWDTLANMHKKDQPQIMQTQEDNPQLPGVETHVFEGNEQIQEDNPHLLSDESQVLEVNEQTQEDNPHLPGHESQVPEVNEQIQEDNPPMPRDESQVPEVNEQIQEDNPQLPRDELQVLEVNEEIQEENSHLPRDEWQVPEERAEVNEQTQADNPRLPIHESQVPEIIEQIQEDNTQLSRDESQVSEVNTGAMNSESLRYYLHELNERIFFGPWETVKRFLEQHPDAIRARNDYGTALHQAVWALHHGVWSEREHTAMELIKLMPKEDLLIQDCCGDTALHIASNLGSTKLVECMIRKNRKLVTMVNERGFLPLGTACSRRQWGVARYLDSVTPVELLFKSDGKNGYKVLKGCFAGGMTGTWEKFKRFLEQHPDAIRVMMTDEGRTALHEAIMSEREDIAMDLIKLMSGEDLEIQDNVGNTALHIAISYGVTKLVECMISKNQKLVTMVSRDGFLPLGKACSKRQWGVARYLCSMTPVELLFKSDGKNGYEVLQGCFAGRMIDTALDILINSPSSDVAMAMIKNSDLLEKLSTHPEAYPSGNQIAFWQQWIYYCINIQPYVPSNCARIYIPDQRETSRSKSITLRGAVLDQLRKFAANYLDFLGIKKIYDLKLEQIRLLELVDCVCGYLLNLDESSNQKSEVIQALKNAARLGIFEFVLKMFSLGPNIHHMSKYDDVRDMIMSAVANRCEKIFGYLSFMIRERKIDDFSIKDQEENTMLHLAAMLSPPSRLSHISGAALQMQRELQWYEHVENLLDPRLHKIQNKNGHTAGKLFTEQHKELMAEGEKWMKAMATSYSVVSALIITIMFTAAFTVPGGYDQNTGLPIFLNKKSFKIFIISDTISFFSASTSVLMFLGILTSRFAEQDFLKSLPTKLIIGLSTLFLSIATMMLVFCATLVMILDGQLKLIVPIVSLAAIPVILFLFLQGPLLVDVLKSTYGPSIFTFKAPEDYKNTGKLVVQQITPRTET